MFKRILVPLDGSDIAEAILPTVQELARCHGAEIVLLCIVSEPILDYAHTVPVVDNRWRDDLESEATDYMTRVKDRLVQAGFQVEAKIGNGPVAREIVEFAHRAGADLIAMSTHGRGGLERLILGSVAEEVVQRARVPVLLVRPRRMK